MPFRSLVGFHPVELKRVAKYLDNEDVDLNAFDINGELSKVSSHPLYKELENGFDVYPKFKPIRLVATIKANGIEWSQHLEEFVKCFRYPIEVNVDFYCWTSSATR